MAPTSTIENWLTLRAALELRLEDGGLKALLVPRQGAALADLTSEELRQFLLEDQRLTALREEDLPDIIGRLKAGKEALVADHGRLPVHGRDGRLTWLVQAPQAQNPDEDGDIDFFAMRDFHAVTKGQPLARLHPPTAGVPGCNVRGEVLMARDGKASAFRAGPNVMLEDESQTFVATMDGRVVVSGDSLWVSRVLEVEKDVDYSTGNITFGGLVNVPGNVRDNFCVEGAEGICVRGLVEAARLASRGAITLKGGVNARDKGAIQTDGDVTAKFVTNADIKARGEVQVAREIVSSRVYGRRVSVARGPIAGGEVCALEQISALEAGSEKGARTLLQVGRDLFAELDLEAAKAREVKLREVIHSLQGTLGPLVQRRDSLTPLDAWKLDRLLEHTSRLESELRELLERLQSARRKALSTQGCIELERGLYPGVVLRIGRYEKTVDKRYAGRRRIYFDEERGDIVIGA
ncbi:MAG TPA: FapA family protein [Planctomycetota bacterium]|nr:FapA family protein [Planctomycetota bacterium]